MLPASPARRMPTISVTDKAKVTINILGKDDAHQNQLAYMIGKALQASGIEVLIEPLKIIGQSDSVPEDQPHNWKIDEKVTVSIRPLILPDRDRDS